MALKILQPGTNPLGQFDGYDTQIANFKGGEVVTLVGVKIGNDKAAADVEYDLDGYLGVANQLRPVVTTTLASGARPLFLADEGIAGYGTLFGSVVGSNAGLTVTGGTVLGPNTTAGSGKVTIWDKPGLYAVTLDACDVTANSGLVVGNVSLTVGAPLYATSAGLITPTITAAFDYVSSPLAGTVIGRFVEFSTDGALVRTPNTLVAGVNSGGGPVKAAFTQAIFQFTPPL